MRAPLVVAAASAALLCAPHPADACSALPCIDAYTYPAEGEVIPSNAPALVYRGSAIFPEAPPPVELTDANGTPVPFVLAESGVGLGSWSVTPAAPLAEGAYTLSSEEACFGEPGGVETTFRVGPPAMLPTQLGNLAGVDARTGALEIEASAQCSERVSTVSIPLELTLDAGAAPWAPLLMYRTVVDGLPWRPKSAAPQVLPVGGSWRGRGVDEIYAHCEPLPAGTANYGLTEGEHTVVMEATLPGTSLLLQSPPLQVTLRCPTGGIDAGAAPDASFTSDGGPGPGLSGMGELVEGEDGCRCADATDGLPILGLLGLLGLLLRRR